MSNMLIGGLMALSAQIGYSMPYKQHVSKKVIFNVRVKQTYYMYTM